MAEDHRDNESNRSDFHYGYEDGRARTLARDDLALLEDYYGRRGGGFFNLPQTIEFGVEFTRGSDWLARGGALDIADMLAQEIQAAYDRLKTKPVQNVKLHVLRDANDISVLPTCDLLYAILSRRHTPATILARVTELLLAKVKPRGVALLRAPTQHRHYQFMLPRPQELAELDVIPQWKLFELLEENAFSLVLVQEEPIFRAADVLYHTILAERRL